MRGHIHRRLHTCKDGKVTVNWYAIVDLPRGPDGRRRQRWYGGYRTRREAEAVLAKLIWELTTRRYVSPSRITVGEYLTQRWLPSLNARLKPTTRCMYGQNIAIHVLPRLGHLPLQAILPGHLTALYGEMLRTGNQMRPGGLSESTVRSISTTLHVAFSDAVDAGLLDYNPADRAKPPRRQPVVISEASCWTPGQLRRFLTAIAADRLAAAYHLAAMTGMRRGEVLGLHWADIDLPAATLTVQHSLVPLPDGTQVLMTPKSNQARTVHLDHDTLAQLEAHRARQVQEQEAWGPSYKVNDLAFRREDGSPVLAGSFSKHFSKMVREAGLPPIRLHDLRHTHASIALHAGVPIKVVSDRLGHADPAFTLRLYAHVLPSMQAEAVALIATRIQTICPQEAVTCV